MADGPDAVRERDALERLQQATRSGASGRDLTGATHHVPLICRSRTRSAIQSSTRPRSLGGTGTGSSAAATVAACNLGSPFHRIGVSTGPISRKRVLNIRATSRRRGRLRAAAIPSRAARCGSAFAEGVVVVQVDNWCNNMGIAAVVVVPIVVVSVASCMGANDMVMNVLGSVVSRRTSPAQLRRIAGMMEGMQPHELPAMAPPSQSRRRRTFSVAWYADIDPATAKGVADNAAERETTRLQGSPPRQPARSASLAQDGRTSPRYAWRLPLHYPGSSGNNLTISHCR